ncbi:MAG: glycerol-3-phosphate dehydrogenase, partial [Alphaproteobacteria bacterium]
MSKTECVALRLPVHNFNSWLLENQAISLFSEAVMLYFRGDMNLPDYDLCVIGGGINGTGIARDAAGRGLSVLLVEAGDLASATSSASTKLIHGGLRYLEYFEFGLVRESLKEREALMQMAPHLVRPMEFILPHDPSQRPRWLIGLGLFIYDMLGGRKKVKSSRRVNLARTHYGLPLQLHLTRGFRFYDCWGDDSRLVAVNAVDAARNGAHIHTRMACIGVAPKERDWVVTLRDCETGAVRETTAGMVVNAAGPWVRSLIDISGLGTPEVPPIRLVKGSHIIVPRVYEGDHAYMLQQPDKRIVFVIPYEKRYSLIGTTETDFTGDPLQAMISDVEMNYLCGAFNRAFRHQIEKKDVLWTYSGVRPLFDDGGASATAVTRDYRIYHHTGHSAPILSIFGGKLTTYRRLAEKTVTRLLELSGHATLPWTRGEPLPGGNIPGGNFDTFLQSQMKKYAWLPLNVVERYARTYGTCMDRFLDGATKMEDLGKSFGDDVYEVEIVYLVKIEFARTADDILWRRTKLGLHIREETMEAIAQALPGILRKGHVDDHSPAGH